MTNITLGQYLPGTSPLHRMDPRTKLCSLFIFIIALFMAKGPASYGLCFLFVALAAILSQVKIKLILRSLRAIIVIVLFTAALNLLYTPGEAIFSVWIFTVTREGARIACAMAVRIILLVAASSLLTFTTSPMSLTDGLETLLSPLKKIKVPVHEFAMMMTIALRFIPTLSDETNKIMSAQKARGADLESGGLIKRAKALIPILVPLFVSSFRRADELATAMECRLYRGGEGRTRLHELKYGKVDAAGYAVTVIVSAGVIALARVFGL